MRKTGNKKWILMFGGWACALVLLVSLMCSSLSKYISGQLADSGGNVAVMNCSFTASVQDVELVNDESGVNVPSTCMIAYEVKNYSDGNVCEVAVRPHFRIYAAAEFLKSMVFQMAEITTETTTKTTTTTTDEGETTTAETTTTTQKIEAITPPYYMAKLLTAGEFSTDGYLSGSESADSESADSESADSDTTDSDTTDSDTTDSESADLESTDTSTPNVENALKALAKLNYTDNTAAETVTVTTNGNNYYYAVCKNAESVQTAAITVTKTTQDQSYTPFFTRGEALLTATSTANDMSASPLYAEVTAEGEYMSLDIELYGVSLPAGEKTERKYACYFAPAANIDNTDILVKTYDELNVSGWYYDAKIPATTTSGNVTATVRVRHDVVENKTTYYVLDGGTKTELIKSVNKDNEDNEDNEDNVESYSDGKYTFSAEVLEKYADYTYNPGSTYTTADDGTVTYNDPYILGKSFGIVYPLQVKMLFEQTQGV